MKKCPFCAEEIQDEVIKCKHCQSALPNKEKNDKYKTLAIVTFIFGILSIFLASIGIVPLITVIIGTVAIFKLKYMQKKNKVLAIIGFILGIFYFISYIFIYSAGGPNILDIAHRLNISYEKEESKKELPPIVGMSINWNKPQYNDIVHWWFSENSDEDYEYWANNEQWECYQNCYIKVFNKNIPSESWTTNLTNNGCKRWAMLPKESKDLLQSPNTQYCVSLVCDNNSGDPGFCWTNKGSNE